MSIELRPDFREAIDFLKGWDADRWLLVAIAPDKRSIEAATFRPDEEEPCRAWVETQNVRRNVYFSVNPPRCDMRKKAMEADIASANYLHVDVDPRIGEDLERERKRILALLQAPPEGIPRPSTIVFSGGGYQAFWRLANPVVLASAAQIAAVKARNLRLEQIFGGDHCHNVDRIMRLPGTVNWPDERKKKKGRVPIVARVTESSDATFAIDSFPVAVMVQDADVSFAGTNEVKISGNVARLGSLEDLPPSVDDYTRVVIQHGHHPMEKGKFPSRSEWLFFVCCSLVRAEVDDETIYGIITDPQFGISESVLDKRGRVDRYARKQIESAREEAVDPQLRELNSKHAVIADYGGRCRIISMTYDETVDRHRISHQGFDDFHNRYANRRVEIGRDPKTGLAVTMPLGKWWIQHAMRRQYDRVVFSPGKEVEGAYNLWRGYAVEPRAGECPLYLQHLREVICRGDEAHMAYVLDWMASAVQNPGKPARTAIVLKGRMGTGKTIFARVFGSLFGRHFVPISDPKYLVGSFNAHLRDCVVLFADEAFAAGVRDKIATLKALVTEELYLMEAKHVDAEVARNCVHLIMASDEDWAVPVGLDDRRFFIVEIDDAKMRNRAWFTAILNEAENGGREALLHMLLTRDLSNYDAFSRPQTAALNVEKMHSLNTSQAWWIERLAEGKLCETHEIWSETVVCAELHDDYLAYCRRWAGTKPKVSSPTQFGIFLQKVCPDGYPAKRQLSGQRSFKSQADGQLREMTRPTAYVFPSLRECREYWDARFGRTQDWSQRQPGEDAVEEVEATPF